VPSTRKGKTHRSGKGKGCVTLQEHGKAETLRVKKSCRRVGEKLTWKRGRPVLSLKRTLRKQ